MNLSGLSAAYPGYLGAEQTSLENQRMQVSNEEAQNKLLGAQVLAKAIFGAAPPQAAPSQPMAPPPGQASVPASPPAAPPPIPAAGGPAPGMGGPPGQPPGAGVIPQIDLQTLAQRIVQTSPDAARNPAVMLAALERAAPILDRQSREDLAELRREYQMQSLEQRGQIARLQVQSANDRAAAAEAGRAARASESEAGRNARSAATEAGRNDRFTQREARVVAQNEIRNDVAHQRLALQRAALEQRIRDGGDRQALSEWRAVVDAQNRRAREVISSKNSLLTWGKGEREAFLKDQDAAYRAAIEGMKGVGAARSPVTAPAPSPAAPAATTAPAQPAAPPASAPATTYPVPPGREKDPDGTTYNGGKFKKQGNVIVPVT